MTDEKNEVKQTTEVETSTTAAKSSKRSGKKRAPAEGKAFIHATFNNTIISIANHNGDIICWGSAGSGGFKGTRKGNAYAAQVAAENAAKKAITMGMREVDVYVKGPGPGRETAIRSLQAAGLEVASIVDITPIPHNGCRPPKPRRV
jgi:small subunit ribosomal protein S11